MAVVNRGVLTKRNPYNRSGAVDVGFTLGTEATDTITVAVQAKNWRGQDLSQRTRVRGYFSKDANGDTLAQGIFAPSGGITAGTDGLLLPGPLSADRLNTAGGLAIHSTPEQFKTTATAAYAVGGVPTTKAAATGLTFSAAHVVTASKFAVVLVQVNAAGTISTKVPVSPQAYTTAALALAALPEPDAGKVALGYIAIAAKAATWTANTDDLTNGSDLTTAAFVDAPTNGPYPPTFEGITEADGDLDLVVAETRVRTATALPLYLVLVVPDGSLKVSGALVFA